MDAPLHIQTAAFACVLQHEVEYAGDGIGTVLGRRAVAEHFDAAQRDRGYGCDVRPLRTIGCAVGNPLDDRAAVPPLVVHQHQGVIRREAAQVHRPHQRSRIPRWIDADMERGHHCAQQVRHVRAALTEQRVHPHRIHRHRGIDLRPRRRSAADDDHFDVVLDGLLDDFVVLRESGLTEQADDERHDGGTSCVSLHGVSRTKCGWLRDSPVPSQPRKGNRNMVLHRVSTACAGSGMRRFGAPAARLGPPVPEASASPSSEVWIRECRQAPTVTDRSWCIARPSGR